MIYEKWRQSLVSITINVYNINRHSDRNKKIASKNNMPDFYFTIHPPGIALECILQLLLNSLFFQTRLIAGQHPFHFPALYLHRQCDGGCPDDREQDQGNLGVHKLIQ